MKKQRARIVGSYADLIAHDEELDRSICGVSLAEERETRFAAEGAHDPSPSFYFVLEELFAHYHFDEHTHLLDVGCGTGRVLAYYLHAGFPGRATGIELDPELAARAASWVAHHANLHVLCGSVLEANLSPYTHFFLYNPFSPTVLQGFIELLEQQASSPCTVIHASDNGDTWNYLGRDGWTQVASGTYQYYRNERGYRVKAYDDPQHYSVWHYEA